MNFQKFQNRQKSHFGPKIEPQAAEAGLAKRKQLPQVLGGLRSPQIDLTGLFKQTRV